MMVAELQRIQVSVHGLDGNEAGGPQIEDFAAGAPRLLEDTFACLAQRVLVLCVPAPGRRALAAWQEYHHDNLTVVDPLQQSPA
ncbi:unnamed protein product [Prorocentrum cordatum]|uniref:Uncharacterized protein n=1 Tax=Prorocentrum cordatum TaxID=2364126 RepID=A0ABN9X8Q3_9DINO|nr:unnamed protein product [Polarella glacialis]